jgi:sulfite reductase beta subunit-like hemoprotein
MSALGDPKTLGNGRLGFADHRDVDVFVDKLARFENGEVSPDEWRAFRLVNGVYGQRQDGQMMIRTKIPQGVLTPRQLEALAEVAERYGDGVGHVTTRQNVQFHFIQLADAEAVLRVLADAGITTREACGNSVRNITGCPYAGTVPGEPFDPSPWAEALTHHLLRGPWSSKLPRKFKIAVGGCCGTDDVQAAINDLGFLGRLDADGRPGFRVLIGGGLATLRRSGFVAHEFLAAEEMLEAAEAVVRVFDRVGDRKNRNKARLKWAIDKLTVSGFMAEYEKERAQIKVEGGRSLRLGDGQPAASLPSFPRTDGRDHSAPPHGPPGTIRRQKQAGFSSVTVRLPLGAVTAKQFRVLAHLARRCGEGSLRTTNEQNLVFRFVPTASVAVLLDELAAAGFNPGGARTITDVTSCPGATSCKLAVTSSRGLAALLTAHLVANPELCALAPELDIKISGCPNGCGQHYIAGIGLQGGMRKIDGRVVPQYLVYLGGGIGSEGASFGRLVGKVPARRVPRLLDRLLRLYVAERLPDEPAHSFFARIPIERVAPLVQEFSDLDATTATPDDFVDIGETAAFAVSLSEGECAA